MNPTTPRPTDAAIALFRDALTGDGMYYLLNDYVHGADVTRADIARALLAHPALARVIAIGQAWVAAEKALPEGWCVGIESDADIDGTDYVTFAGPNAHPRKGKHATADTPEAALEALALALTEMGGRCGDRQWDSRYECVKPSGHPVDGPGLTDHDYRPALVAALTDQERGS